ncbi:hypothetical protein DPMN_086634 [Dreissena polymorpha]|uniref:Uncharacterized protein n=1 Tax=Dreissena polymorpha TaxID=45954 RepID=A0A9D4KSP1_DREPO|nr:hypothetical protein DPMN_086634 [Dreissena polymorpha]
MRFSNGYGDIQSPFNTILLPCRTLNMSDGTESGLRPTLMSQSAVTLMSQSAVTLMSQSAVAPELLNETLDFRIKVSGGIHSGT